MKFPKNKIHDLCWAILSGVIAFLLLTLLDYLIKVSAVLLKQIIASFISMGIFMIEQIKYLKHD